MVCAGSVVVVLGGGAGGGGSKDIKVDFGVSSHCGLGGPVNSHHPGDEVFLRLR
jgi:hypothetical protein